MTTSTTIIDVDSEALASILILDRELEPYPEPFRGQPNVRVNVEFEEYLTFCNMLGNYNGLTYTGSDMHHLVTEYRKGSSEAKDKLWEAFSKDVAVGILKEVYWAETLGKEATVIMHECSNPTVTLTEEDIQFYFANVRELVQANALDRFTSNKYIYPPSISSKHNGAQYKRAITMYYLADKKFTWRFD